MSATLFLAMSMWATPYTYADLPTEESPVLWGGTNMCYQFDGSDDSDDANDAGSNR